MWDVVRAVLGELSREEAVLTAILFFSIFGYSWLPKLGEVIGGFLAAEDPVDETRGDDA